MASCKGVGRRACVLVYVCAPLHTHTHTHTHTRTHTHTHTPTHTHTHMLPFHSYILFAHSFFSLFLLVSSQVFMRFLTLSRMYMSYISIMSAFTLRFYYACVPFVLILCLYSYRMSITSGLILYFFLHICSCIYPFLHIYSCICPYLSRFFFDHHFLDLRRFFDRFLF